MLPGPPPQKKTVEVVVVVGVVGAEPDLRTPVFSCFLFMSLLAWGDLLSCSLHKKTVGVVVVVEVWGGVRLWPVVCRPSIPIGHYCYCHRGGVEKKNGFTYALGNAYVLWGLNAPEENVRVCFTTIIQR